jgi:hypothetical protein
VESDFLSPRMTPKCRSIDFRISSDSVRHTMKISRRAFHTTLLSATAAAHAARQDSPVPPQKLALPPVPDWW